MSNTPIQVSYSLEEVLARIESKIDDFRKETDARLSNLETGQVRLEAQLKGDIKSLDEKLSGQIKNVDERLSGQIKNVDERLSGQIKNVDEKLSGKINTLDVKIEGFGKRLENQEFVNRGILVALVVAILGSAAKLLGWVGNP